ncbi:MAG: YigZ family protein [Oscillospiraceae bacterium]|nr:YigZ family protein [Oscillospiraceae bacterium]
MTEYTEKKSRFIGYSAMISDEQEAKTIIAHLQKEHKRSAHVVYAYVVNGREKCDDNGEPRGTAGLPVLTAIKRRDLDGIIVAVVRYYGGIMLGKGGLIRAYGKTAGMELDRMQAEG